MEEQEEEEEADLHQGNLTHTSGAAAPPGGHTEFCNHACPPEAGRIFSASRQNEHIVSFLAVSHDDANWLSSCLSFSDERVKRSGLIEAPAAVGLSLVFTSLTYNKGNKLSLAAPVSNTHIHEHKDVSAVRRWYRSMMRMRGDASTHPHHPSPVPDQHMLPCSCRWRSLSQTASHLLAWRYC